MTLIQFDRRATHRIFSEPVALDTINDVTALSDEAIKYLEAIHWLALGTGDEHLVKGIAAAHRRVMAIRDRANVAAGAGRGVTSHRPLRSGAVRGGRGVMPRLLDLFCGAGGAAMGYHRAGFEVVGVDIKPQPHYPFEFIQADALEWLDDPKGNSWPFDAIHASPPCQAYTHARLLAGRGKPDHPRLVGPVRELLRATGLHYVIENVVGAPLDNSVELCGPSFGLDVKRHRLFESSILLMSPPICACSMDRPQRFPSTPRVEFGFRDIDGPRPLSRYVNPLASGTTHEMFAEAMGIDWIPAKGKRPAPGLHEAIPPAYTEWIGRQLLQVIERVAA